MFPIEHVSPRSLNEEILALIRIQKSWASTNVIWICNFLVLEEQAIFLRSEETNCPRFRVSVDAWTVGNYSWKRRAAVVDPDAPLTLQI